MYSKCSINNNQTMEKEITDIFEYISSISSEKFIDFIKDNNKCIVQKTNAIFHHEFTFYF